MRRLCQSLCLCHSSRSAASDVMRWRRGTCGFIGWCRQWCVMRCLLDVRMAGDEMMRCSCPVSHRHSSPFALPPLPGSSRFACLCLFPRPRVVGGAGGCRFAAAGGWRSACLSSSPCRTLAHRSFAFPVGLRLSASLLAWFRRRLYCRVVSYSILDDVMRITGSCGIRLVVYPACLPVVVSVPRAMWAAVSSRSSCRRTVRLSPLLA